MIIDELLALLGLFQQSAGALVGPTTQSTIKAILAGMVRSASFCS